MHALSLWLVLQWLDEAGDGVCIKGERLARMMGGCITHAYVHTRMPPASMLACHSHHLNVGTCFPSCTRDAHDEYCLPIMAKALLDSVTGTGTCMQMELPQQTFLTSSKSTVLQGR